jgi:hypothetical protein
MLLSTPVPDFGTFDLENAFMDQQEPNMMANELQQNHVQHQQGARQQQERQQQQQQEQPILPNIIDHLPMEIFSQEQVQQKQQQHQQQQQQQQHQKQQQQQPLLPNQIEQLNPLQQQPMEVPAQAQNHQQPNIAHHQLRFQEDSQPILLDSHSQFQQQAHSVNQQELIQQLTEGPFSGL